MMLVCVSSFFLLRNNVCFLSLIINFSDMKILIIMVMAIVLMSCRRNAEEWQDPEEGKDVPMVVRAFSATEVRPLGYRLFLFDEQNQLKTYRVGAEESENGRFSLGIGSGNYTAYCVVNAVEEDLFDYTAESTPSQVFLKLKQEGNSWCEAGDYLLGTALFTVEGNETETVVFESERKVGLVRVIVENVPDWMSDLGIHISGIPPKMNLLGKYSGEGVAVEKAAGIPDGSGRSETNVLIYPPAKSCVLTLTYRAGLSIGETAAYRLDSVAVNRITEVRAVFRSPSDVRNVEFYSGILDWDDRVILGDDWYIDLPQGPCTGKGNGINLVRNGGFEEGEDTGIPLEWKLDAGGSDKRVVSVASPVQEGGRAVRLEGKTYLYQDVAVEAGQCYQLQMYVNSETADVKWRYWCTWMAGSNSLGSEEVRSSAFRYQTGGYEDVFAGNVFKAPAGATKLRMEVRTYTSPAEAGKGLCVDGVRMEKVE